MFRISVIRRSNKRLGLLTVVLVADIPDQLLGFSRNRLGFFHHRSLLVDQIKTLCSIAASDPLISLSSPRSAVDRSSWIWPRLFSSLLKSSLISLISDSTSNVSWNFTKKVSSSSISLLQADKI